MQKYTGLDQKSKLPANTESTWYTENLLGVSLWRKKGLSFLVWWWPRLKANQGTLGECEHFIWKLGQKPTGLLLCFPRQSSRPAPLCYKAPFQSQSPVLRCLFFTSWSLPICAYANKLAFCLIRQQKAGYVPNLQQTWDNMSQFPHPKYEKSLWMTKRSWHLKMLKLWLYDSVFFP